MKYILFLVTSFVFVAVPALAQQAGVPGLQEQINALQVQNASLQQQITSLQTSVGGLQTQMNELISFGVGDDGTAGAIVGTWTGWVNSVHFETSAGLPFFRVFGAVQDSVTPNFTVPIPGLGDMIVGVNPARWLVEGQSNPVTFTLTRDGMKLLGTATDVDNHLIQLRGTVVSNNFFVLKVILPATGPCGTRVVQGTGSLSSDRMRMVFTGSGIGEDCSSHEVVSVSLTK